MKYLFFFYCFFIAEILHAQNEICYSVEGYKESKFKIKKTRNNNIYRVKMMDLGINYLNPCVKDVTSINDSSFVLIYFNKEDSSLNSKMKIMVMNEIKRKAKKFKNQKFKVEKELGIFNINELINISCYKSNRIILYFESVSHKENSIVIQLDTIKF